jgi:hypothetical protein
MELSKTWWAVRRYTHDSYPSSLFGLTLGISPEWAETGRRCGSLYWQDGMRLSRTVNRKRNTTSETPKP